MSGLKGYNVIVLGASSGIGEATARELSHQGARLILGARREEKLRNLVGELRLNGSELDYHLVDVRRKDEVKRFVEFAVQKLGRVDALVNSAGVMLLSKLEALKFEEWEHMIDTNLKGLLYAAGGIIPQMVKQGKGHIVNISSVGAEKVFPTAGVYCATKFAVDALSESIRQEFRGIIRCSQICPGMVKSELLDNISQADIKRANEVAYRIALEASHVAKAICYVLSQPPEVDINKIVLRPSRQEF